MGITNSPDIFQAVMMDVLGDLEYVCTYIDDILITSSGMHYTGSTGIVDVIDK